VRKSVKAESRAIDTASFDAETVARQIWEKTNIERARAGLGQLSWNPQLAVAANGHSSDMAQRQYFSHKSKGLFKKTDLKDRTTAAGYTGGMIAENIAMLPTFRNQRFHYSTGRDGRQLTQVETDGNTYEQLTDWAMEQWMNSPGHRQNILHPGLNSLGVGVALGSKDGVPYVYLTQNFAGGR